MQLEEKAVELEDGELSSEEFSNFSRNVNKPFDEALFAESMQSKMNCVRNVSNNSTFRNI